MKVWSQMLTLCSLLLGSSYCSCSVYPAFLSWLSRSPGSCWFLRLVFLYSCSAAFPGLSQLGWVRLRWCLWRWIVDLVSEWMSWLGIWLLTSLLHHRFHVGIGLPNVEATVIVQEWMLRFSPCLHDGMWQFESHQAAQLPSCSRQTCIHNNFHAHIRFGSQQWNRIGGCISLLTLCLPTLQPNQTHDGLWFDHWQTKAKRNG